MEPVAYKAGGGRVDKMMEQEGRKRKVMEGKMSVEKTEEQIPKWQGKLLALSKRRTSFSCR